MSTAVKVTFAGAIGGIVGAGLVIAALVAVPALSAFGQTPEGGQQSAPTHEQMHQMMDAMHGEGTSARMHEMMGEQMMDQCVQMMAMMQNMPGMMGGQSDQSMQEMMQR
ncbi:MAG: hypothetical protein GEU73_12965 [Chloroflexi bacterium]|nr:hypothetical protein [Chloroflexota bacterium]